ncbi:ACP S-malonyltransferase [Williamsia sterculiae]|uniref:[acyl-carrier-protein] S-malonyltransferase n=1 Tax=Williamsia sterculiae TaxID=1344003 RepID=A0A1N7DPL3_9NOCA|nr:ACP S-malonyltransferase [Williamsia sterculiae]SIR77729.1 [acyl-carrier-protein] S-malonyltransferase/trans-AT polyketide synthase, acyltransferase and oxidoreductase domain-containing protein [Williamsia sterculiae]
MHTPNPDSYTGTTVYMFPGQGSQVPGMRQVVASWCPELLDVADRLVGEPLMVRPTDDTRLLQPAIYLASIAGWLCAADLRDSGNPPPSIPAIPAADVILGHSLGEVAALAVGGAFSALDGLHIVVRRGELMAEAAAAQPGGGMMAALGAPAETVQNLAADLSLIVATDNAPGQTVLAGRRDDLERAEHALFADGHKAVLLPIEGAFHSPEMNCIKDEFISAVHAATPHTPGVPVISSHTGREFTDVPSQLGDSLVGAVNFRQSLLALRQRGFTDFVDCGPGHVLARLVRRTLGTDATSIYDLHDGQLVMPPLQKGA